MLVMERTASDNKYLHRDFHISTDNGIEYVGNKYGDGGVIDFLSRFSNSYFQLLVNDYKEKGLVVIKDYIENIYKTEEIDATQSMVGYRKVTRVKKLESIVSVIKDFDFFCR